MARAGTAYVDFEGDFSKLNRQLAGEQRIWDNLNVNVSVGLNKGDQARVRSEIDSLSGTQRVEVKIDYDRGALRRLNSDLKSASGGANGLTSSLAGLGSAAVGSVSAMGGLSVLLADVAGGAVALTAALSPLVGLLGAIPGGLIGLGQIIGTVGIGFQGIGGAIKAGNDALNVNTRQTKSNAAAQKSAGNQIRSATQGVTDAQERLSRSQENAQTVQGRLSAARAAARRDLDDLRIAAEKADEAQSGASLSLEESQRRLSQAMSDPTTSSLDLRKAQQDVADAQTNVTQTTVDQKRAHDDNNKAQKAGVAGSEKVKQAQKDIADANRQVADAQRDVARSQEQLAQAQQGAADAAAKNTTAVDKYRDALKNLSPAQRDFVKLIVDLRPKFQELQQAIGEHMFPGLASGITSAMRNFNVLKGGLSGTADVIGDLADKAGKLIGSKAFGKDFGSIMASNNRTMKSVGDGALGFASGLRHIAVAAEPLVEWLGKVFDQAGRGFEKWAEGARKSGELAKFFERTKDVLTGLWHIFRDTAAGFINIFSAARSAGSDQILGAIERGAKAFREWTGSKEGQDRLKRFFEDIKDPLEAIAKGALAVGGLVGSLTEHQEGLTFVVNAFTDLVGAVKYLVDNVPGFGEVLTGAFGVAMLSRMPVLSALTKMGEGNVLEKIGTKLPKLIGAGGGAAAGAEGATAAEGVAGASAAGPIAVGVVALGVAAFEAYKHIKVFHDFVDKAWDDIVGWTTGAVNTISTFFKKHTDDWIAMWNGVKWVVNTIIDIAKTVWVILGPIVDFVAKNFVGGIKRALDGLVQTFRGLGDLLSGVVDTIGAVLRGDFRGMIKGIGEIFKGLGEILLGSLRAITAPIRELGARIGHAVASAFHSALGALGDAGHWIWQELSDAIHSVGDALSSIGGRVIHAVLNGLSDAVHAAGGALEDIGKRIANAIWDGIKKGPAGVAKIITKGLDLAFAAGGPVPGYGGGDRVRALLEPGEHVWTKSEVRAAGGHASMYAMRSYFGGGGQGAGGRYQVGGQPHQAAQNNPQGSYMARQQQAQVERDQQDTNRRQESENLRSTSERVRRWQAMWTDMQTIARRGANEIEKQFRDMRVNTAASADAMYRQVRTSFADIEKSADVRGAGISSQWKGSWDHVTQIVYDALFYIGHETNRALKGLGADTINFGLTAPTVKGAQRGWYVPGYGTGDSVPALLEPGEVVMNRKAVKAVGKDRLLGLNSTFSRFQAGGYTGPGHSGAGFTPIWNMAKNKFGMSYFTGFDGHSKMTTSGNVSDHFFHRALDMGNGVLTASEDALSTFFKTKVPQVVKQLIWRSIDQFTGAEIGDHEDHVHLAMPDQYASDDSLMAKILSRATRGLSINDLLQGGTGGADHIDRLLVKGPRGGLTSGVQRALDLVRNAANKFIDNKATAFSDPGSEVSHGGSAGGKGVFDFFKGQGFSDAQAAAWVGNFSQETGGTFNPAIIQPGGEGHGLAQWGGGRFAALQDFAKTRGTDWTDLSTQLAFVMHELGGSERGAASSIRSARSIQDAVSVIATQYERAGIIGNRIGPARDAFNAYAHLMRGGLVGMQAGGDPNAPLPKKRLPVSLATGEVKKILDSLSGGLKKGKLKPDVQGRFARLTNHILAAFLPPEWKSDIGNLKNSITIADTLATQADTVTDKDAITLAVQGKTDELGRRMSPGELGGLITPMLGTANGQNQLDWMAQKIVAIGAFRNRLIDIALKIKKAIDEWTAAIAEAQAVHDKYTALIKDANAKKNKKGATKKQKDAYDKQIAEWKPKLTAADGVLNSLTGQRGAYIGFLNEDILPGLVDVQSYPEGALTQFVLGKPNPMAGYAFTNYDPRALSIPPFSPAFGTLGGSILTAQAGLKTATDFASFAVDPRERPGERELKDLVADLTAAEAKRQLERTVGLTTVASFLRAPFGGSFELGGVVPGRIGQPIMIMAHGGETVTPVDQVAPMASETHVHISGKDAWLNNVIDTRVEHRTRQQSNRASRLLPGAGRQGRI